MKIILILVSLFLVLPNVALAQEATTMPSSEWIPDPEPTKEFENLVLKDRIKRLEDELADAQQRTKQPRQRPYGTKFQIPHPSMQCNDTKIIIDRLQASGFILMGYSPLLNESKIPIGMEMFWAHEKTNTVTLVIMNYLHKASCIKDTFKNFEFSSEGVKALTPHSNDKEAKYHEFRMSYSPVSITQ
jgi:hypothetical protein